MQTTEQSEYVVRSYPLARPNYGVEEIAAVVATLKSGQTTRGPKVKAFEQRFAEYVGRRHAIMVNSGSSADLLVAFGLGPAKEGEEILVPAVTWPTQVWSCLMAGYRVRLVDVDPATLQTNTVDLASKMNRKTKAIFLVHVLGNVGDMDAVGDISQGVPIIEDCCEALGARWDGRHVGRVGQAAAFSFFFSHLITTMEGGMVVTDSPTADRQYRLWRSHGWEPKEDYRFWFPTWGLNVRPTEVQGAFGYVQMSRIEEYRQARQLNAARLQARIETPHLRMPVVLPQCEPSWHGFPLMVAEDAQFTRDELCRHLNAHGIETRPVIAGNMARQPAIQNEPRVIAGDLPGADAVHDRGFYMGLSSYDDSAGTAYVAEMIAEFVKG